jgi:prephenate dehydrogenase
MGPERLAILGVGLLGGSIGLAVKNRLRSCKVIGYAHRPETLQASLQMGAIDIGFDHPARAVEGADLVILCTPVLMIAPLMTEISSSLAAGLVVTDVGSTKGSIVRDAATIMPAHASFVGSHPMAGSEKRGVQFARADLFENALCIVTPDDASKPTAVDRVSSFWELLGMRVTHMTPAAHDSAVSDVSHLPHLLAAALISMQDESSPNVAGRGFLDMTRIAAGDGGLWRDILLDNRQRVLESIQRFRKQLGAVEQLLIDGDSDGIKRWLEDAAARRETMSSAKRDK